MKKLYILGFITYLLPLQGHDFSMNSIYDVIKERPDIEYIKTQDAYSFNYTQFPISIMPDTQPNMGTFCENYVVKIPNGQVCSSNGFVKIDNHIMIESFPYSSYQAHKDALDSQNFDNLTKIPGKIAVLTCRYDYCYFHWICDVLGRLIMLQKNNITYDWLYVCSDFPFMKETLALCGVDSAKIIQPFGKTTYIQADELIVPSLPARRILTDNQLYTKDFDLVSHCQNWTIDYLRTLFIPLSKQVSNNFAKKIFISRKDAKYRQIYNEDEIFALFKEQGFTRYSLANMSILEQVALFNQAETIAGTHGAGLINIMFCKPNTHLIEIFQARSDASFFYMSQQIPLNYHYIKTMEFPLDQGLGGTSIDPSIIQNFIEENIDLFNHEKTI